MWHLAVAEAGSTLFLPSRAPCAVFGRVDGWLPASGFFTGVWGCPPWARAGAVLRRPAGMGLRGGPLCFWLVRGAGLWRRGQLCRPCRPPSLLPPACRRFHVPLPSLLDPGSPGGCERAAPVVWLCICSWGLMSGPCVSLLAVVQGRFAFNFLFGKLWVHKDRRAQ